MAEFSFDRLANVPGHLAGQAAFAALSNLQIFPPEQRVAGAALLFVALCRRFRVHPGNALNIAGNISREMTGRSAELGAMSDYLKHELEKE